MAVFFPVIYVPGIAGEFFRDQALTVTISLLVSIAAALLLQPTLSARILEQEHAAYSEALAMLMTIPWRLVGRRLLWQAGD